MNYQRVLTVQDISCVGQCSLTVALPILSACGLETAVLPSAVLSNHTGGFSGWTFRDLTEDMPSINRQWMKEGINFDALYTGYLGSKQQIEYVCDIARDSLKAGGKLIVDPAMADNGKLYYGFDQLFVEEMKKLCARADMILPNITEACFLTGIPYQETYTETYIQSLLQELTAQGCKTVILTGVSFNPQTTGVVTYDNEKMHYYCHSKISGGCHGTGDAFAAAFTGALMQGKTVEASAKIAADYVVECIRITFEDPTHWYGVKFEPALPCLMKDIGLL